MRRVIRVLLLTGLTWIPALGVEPAGQVERAPEQRELLRKAGLAKWVDKDPGKAMDLYAQAFALGPLTERGFYLPAAECAAQAGQADRAFEWMDRELVVGWANPREGLNTYDFSAVKGDPRYAGFIERAERARTEYLASVSPERLGLQPGSAVATVTRWRDDPSVGAAEFAVRLWAWSEFPRPTATGTWFAPEPPVFEGESVHFTLYVPKGYDPTRPTPMVVWMSGGFHERTAVFPPERKDHEYNPLIEQADALGFVLLHSQSSKKFDTTRVLGQRAVRAQVGLVKRVLNIDDDRVFYMGHSDGATGVIRTAALDPTPYCGFGPIAYMPVLGAFFGNANARPILSISGEKDGLYDAAKSALIADFGRTLGARWSSWIEPEAEHGFQPWLRPILPGYLRVALGGRRANADRLSIAAHTKQGRINVDWLALVAADGARPTSATHRAWSVGVPQSNGAVVKFDGETDWGYLDGVRRGNRFELQTSRVAKAAVRLRAGDIDPAQPVVITVNGREVHNATLTPDKAQIAEWFLTDFDRQRVWLGEVMVEVPE